MSTATAKVILSAEDRTAQAFRSVQKNLGDIAGVARKLFPVLGFAASAEGLRKLGREVFQTSQQISQLITSSRNLAEVRQKLGNLSISVTDEDLRQAAELSRSIDTLKSSFTSLKIEIAAASNQLLSFLGIGNSREALEKQLVGARERLRTAPAVADTSEIRAEINRLERLLGQAGGGPQGPRRFPGQGTPTEAAARIRDRTRDPKKEAEAALKAALEADLMLRQAAQIQTDAIRSLSAIPGGGDGSLEITRALTEGSAEALEALAKTATAATSQFTAATDEMSVFADEAARNLQDAFAQFFLNFDQGLDGMLRGFVDTLRRMAAEAAASQILGMVFGGLAGSSNSFLAGLGKAFGGGRAAGGPVSAGTSYLVGERGPEIFVPGSSGRIVPNGGGVSISANYNVDARGATADLAQALPGLFAQNNKELLRLFTQAMSRSGLATPVI